VKKKKPESKKLCQKRKANRPLNLTPKDMGNMGYFGSSDSYGDSRSSNSGSSDSESDYDYP